MRDNLQANRQQLPADRQLTVCPLQHWLGVAALVTGSYSTAAAQLPQLPALGSSAQPNSSNWQGSDKLPQLTELPKLPPATGLQKPQLIERLPSGPINATLPPAASLGVPLQAAPRNSVPPSNPAAPSNQAGEHATQPSAKPTAMPAAREEVPLQIHLPKPVELPVQFAAPKFRYIDRSDLQSESVVRHVQSRPVLLEPLDEKAAVPVVTALAADPSGEFLAVAGDDHAIRIVRASSGEQLQTLKGHRDWIHALVFSDVGDPAAGETPVLYSAGDDGRVLRWSWNQPPVEIFALRDAGQTELSPIRSLSFSSQRNLLAIGGINESQTVFLLEITAEDQSGLAALNRMGDAARYGEGVRVRLRHKLTCDCREQRCVKFSPDGGLVLCGSRDGEMHVWSTETGDEVAHYQEHTGRIYTASFSGDGGTITSVGEDRRLVQYELGAGKQLLRKLELPAKLMSMCLINDSVVAFAGADNSIQLYNFRSDRVIADLRQHLGSVAVLCPVGDSLASGSFDTTVRIWDLQSIEWQANPTGQPVSFTPLKIDDNLRIR